MVTLNYSTTMCISLFGCLIILLCIFAINDSIYKLNKNKLSHEWVKGRICKYRIKVYQVSQNKYYFKYVSFKMLGIECFTTYCRKKSTGDEMSMTPFHFISMEELKQHVNKIRQDGNSSKIRQFKCYL